MSEFTLIPNYLKIVTDKATNSYRLEFYNSTTATWEVVLEIDPASKIIKVHPTFNDDLKLSFGSDRDYTLRFDSAADAFILRDEVNGVDILAIGRNGLITAIGFLADDLKLFFGSDRDFSIRFDSTNNDLRIRDELNATEIIVPRNQNRDLGQFSKYRKAEETAGVGIGVAGSPATIVALDITDPDFMNLMPLKVTATPSGLGTNESATFDVDAILDDGTRVTLASKTTAAGSTATETFLITDFDFALIPDGRRIVRLELTAESSATSTTATATGSIVAVEHD